jgi:hypothetical protein
MRDSITVAVETDMFEHKEAKAHFINPCCFGEDFAVWLQQQLSPLRDSGFVFSEPLQEGYGWGFWVWHRGDPFWLAISYVGDGPQRAPPEWIISVNYDHGLNRIKRLFHKPDQHALETLRNHVRQAVTSNAAMRIVPLSRYAPDGLGSTSHEKK